jgi:hypothetical protein
LARTSSPPVGNLSRNRPAAAASRTDGSGSDTTIEILQHQIKLAAKRGLLPGIATGTALAADDVDYVVAKFFGFKSIDAMRKFVTRRRGEAKKR